MPSSALTWEKSKGQEFPSTVLIKKKKKPNNNNVKKEGTEKNT